MRVHTDMTVEQATAWKNNVGRRIVFLSSDDEQEVADIA